MKMVFNEFLLLLPCLFLLQNIIFVQGSSQQVTKKGIAKRNQVQFRNSTGKLIATLKDPRNPNDANVTLSRNDDLRRYSQELRRISLTRNHISQIQKAFNSGIGNREKVRSNSFGKRHLTPEEIEDDEAASQESKTRRDDITPFIEKLRESSATARAIDNAHKTHSKNNNNNLSKEKKKDLTENRFPHFYAHISHVHTAHAPHLAMEQEITQLHEHAVSLPIEPVKDKNFKIMPPNDEELGKFPLNWQKILGVDDIADSIKFEDVPDKDKPCHFSDKAEPGSNAHNGQEQHDKPAGNHKRGLRKKCAHGLPIKEKRQANDVKDTIDDILSFYNEVSGLNDKSKYKRSKEYRTNSMKDKNLQFAFHRGPVQSTKQFEANVNKIKELNDTSLLGERNARGVLYKIRVRDGIPPADNLARHSKKGFLLPIVKDLSGTTHLDTPSMDADRADKFSQEESLDRSGSVMVSEATGRRRDEEEARQTLDGDLIEDDKSPNNNKTNVTRKDEVESIGKLIGGFKEFPSTSLSKKRDTVAVDNTNNTMESNNENGEGEDTEEEDEEASQLPGDEQITRNTTLKNNSANNNSFDLNVGIGDEDDDFITVHAGNPAVQMMEESTRNGDSSIIANATRKSIEKESNSSVEEDSIVAKIIKPSGENSTTPDDSKTSVPSTNNDIYPSTSQSHADNNTLLHNAAVESSDSSSAEEVNNKDMEPNIHISSDEKTELSLEEEVAQQLYKDSAAKKSAIPATPPKKRNNIDRLVLQMTQHILHGVNSDRSSTLKLNQDKKFKHNEIRITPQELTARLKHVLKGFAMQLGQDTLTSRDKISDKATPRKNERTERIYFSKPESTNVDVVETPNKSRMCRDCNNCTSSSCKHVENVKTQTDDDGSVPDEHQRFSISPQPQFIYQPSTKFYTNQRLPFYFQPYNNGIPLQRSQQFPTTGWRSILPPPGAQISSGGITAFQQQLTDNNDIFINKVSNNIIQHGENCAQLSPCSCKQYPCTCMQRICKCSDSCCNIPPCLCSCNADLQDDAGATNNVMTVICQRPDQACVCPYGVSSKCFCHPSFSSNSNFRFSHSNMEFMTPTSKQAIAPCVFPPCILNQDKGSSCNDCYTVCSKNDATNLCFMPCKCKKHRNHLKPFEESSASLRKKIPSRSSEDLQRRNISLKKKSAQNGSIQKKKAHKTRRIKQATPMNIHPVQTIVQLPPTSPLTRPTPSTTNTTLPAPIATLLPSPVTVAISLSPLSLPSSYSQSVAPQLSGRGSSTSIGVKSKSSSTLSTKTADVSSSFHPGDQMNKDHTKAVKTDRLRDFVKDIAHKVFADPHHVVKTAQEFEQRLTDVLFEAFTKRSGRHKENKPELDRSTEGASKRHLLSNSTSPQVKEHRMISTHKSEIKSESEKSRPGQIKSRIDGLTNFSNSKFKSKIEVLKMHTPLPSATLPFKHKKSKARIKIRNTKGHLILGAIKYHDISKPETSNAIKYATTPGSNNKMPDILRYQSTIQTRRSTIPKLTTMGKDRSSRKRVVFSSGKGKTRDDIKKKTFSHQGKNTQFHYPTLNTHSKKTLFSPKFSYGALNNIASFKKKKNKLPKRSEKHKILMPTNLEIVLNQQSHSLLKRKKSSDV